jgi:hypothetical protein
MLVDNKFIYISLPRCASSSFHISCIRNNLDIKFANITGNNQHYDLSLSNHKLLESIIHFHERTFELDLTFGNQYDIISVKRDRYHRFISMWKYVVDASKRYGEGIYILMSRLTINDILWFNAGDILKDNIDNTIRLFLERYNILNIVDDYFKSLLFILWQPTSFWHNNDFRINWFNFDDIYSLEDWVSNKIGKSFKLEKINSSNHTATYLELNEEFIMGYNKMYDTFDLVKTKNSII